MIELFLTHDFLLYALLAALATGLASPVVGTYLVQRRLALMGDGLGHVAVTGVALGLVTGSSPTWTAVVVAIIGAVLIEVIRERGHTNGDVALALLFYGGIAAGVLITGLAGQSAASLQAYLFGALLSISQADVVATIALAVVVIVLVTCLFILSAVTGIERGIQFLADMGMFATIGLFLFFLVAGGATVLVISEGIESIGGYIIEVLPMSLRMGIGDEDWMAAWTIFYWAWWISWAPFVGMFVARISRGRTIREFVLGVVAAPTGFGFLWFAVVGGTGIQLQRSGRADLLGIVDTPELSFFTALDALPLPMISSFVAILLVALFFISGADAASVVMATMATRGALEPPRFVVVVLGLLMGGIACAMLLVGGLGALQQAAILGSVPFTFVVIAVAVAWVKALREEPRPGRQPPQAIPLARPYRAPARTNAPEAGAETGAES